MSEPLEQYRDCTIKTLVAATGIPYEQAARELKARGKRKNCGAHMHQWLPLLKKHAESVKEISMPRMTVKRLLRDELPAKGMYVARVSGHVFCIMDRKAADGCWFEENSIVTRLWRVVRSTSYERGWRQLDQ